MTPETERELMLAKRLVASDEWKWFVETFLEHTKEVALQQLLGARDTVDIHTARGGYALASELIEGPAGFVAEIEAQEQLSKESAGLHGDPESQE